MLQRRKEAIRIVYGHVITKSQVYVISVVLRLACVTLQQCRMFAVFYFARGRLAKYCDQHVCMSVSLLVCSVCSHISKTTCHFYTRYLPLTAVQYVMYFRFLDDVKFHIIEPVGQNQDDAYVSSSCEVAAPWAKFAVSDCILFVE